MTNLDVFENRQELKKNHKLTRSLIFEQKNFCLRSAREVSRIRFGETANSMAASVFLDRSPFLRKPPLLCPILSSFQRVLEFREKYAIRMILSRRTRIRRSFCAIVALSPINDDLMRKNGHKSRRKVRPPKWTADSESATSN